MQEIKLRIAKKTLVPTKFQRVNMWRSDWKHIYSIEYWDTGRLFREINPNSTIINDAQFAKWLKDNFGTGHYLVRAWKKGREGFWIFMKVECRDDCFIRLQRRKSRTRLEIEEKAREFRKLNKTLKEQGLYADEKSSISEDIDNIKEELELDKEIAELENGKYGPSPYLKSCMPVYFPHEYQDYNEYIIPQKIDRRVVSIKRINKEMEKEKQEVSKAEEPPVNTLW